MAGDASLATSRLPGPAPGSPVPGKPTPPRVSRIAAARRIGRDALRSSIHGPFHDELRDAQRDVVLQRTAILIGISMFVMPTACLAFAYVTTPGYFGLALWIVAVGVLMQSSLWLALRRGAFRTHYHLAMLVLVGGVFGPVGSAIMVLATASGGSFLFAYFLIYFAFTALFPANVLWIVLTSIAITASYVGASFVHHDPELVSNLIYFVELTFIGVVLNRVMCKLFFDERRARIELGRARDALFAEMEVAQQIQTLLLPREPALPGYVLAGSMTPASEVGGDYYDVIETARGRRLVAIGDVSGHGVTTGLTMMMVRASLVSTLESRADATLAELYIAMNRCLCRNLERMGLRLYMTFALLEHDGGGEFRVVGAHLPALIHRAAKQTVEEIEVAGVWLGVIDDITPELVPETAFALGKGDTMLLLTDGVVEHIGGQGMFGFERVHAELAANAAHGPAQVIEALTTRVAEHGGAQEDDITLLAMKYVGEVDPARMS